MSRARGVLAAVALLLVLTGCTSAQSPTPSVTSVAPSAPATAVEAGLLADGDCTHLLDPAEVATSLGGSTDAKVGTTGFELGLVGGIGCTYNFGEQGASDHSQVLVDVAPATIADPGELEASLAPVVCDDGADLAAHNAGCTATVAVSGWWYTLSVFTFESSQAQETSFAAITSMLKQALTAVEAPERASVVEPFDCDAADTGGLPVSGSRDLPGPEQGAISVAAARLAAPVTCAFTSADSGQWYVDVYPASLAAYEQCALIRAAGAPPGSPITVPGVESAYAMSPEDGPVRVCATDGVSTVTAVREDAGVWDAASLETLGSIVVPVLAAAG